MEDDEITEYFVGDIVGELEVIVPPGRNCFYGIVMYIEKNSYFFNNDSNYSQDLIAVKWFKSDNVEKLPATVIKLIQSVKLKND